MQHVSVRHRQTRAPPPKNVWKPKWLSSAEKVLLTAPHPATSKCQQLTLNAVLVVTFYFFTGKITTCREGLSEPSLWSVSPLRRGAKRRVCGDTSSQRGLKKPVVSEQEACWKCLQSLVLRWLLGVLRITGSLKLPAASRAWKCHSLGETDAVPVRHRVSRSAESRGSWGRKSGAGPP